VEERRNLEKKSVIDRVVLSTTPPRGVVATLEVGVGVRRGRGPFTGRNKKLN
jgi:hypothetical protein